MSAQRPNPTKVGLPIRPFLYTLDQVAELIQVDVGILRSEYIFFDGVEVGKIMPRRIVARNIRPDGERPDWRVAEQELVRWLKHMGFRIYENRWATV